MVLMSCFLRNIMNLELQKTTLTEKTPFPKCPYKGCKKEITTSTQVLQEVMDQASFEIYCRELKIRKYF